MITSWNSIYVLEICNDRIVFEKCRTGTLLFSVHTEWKAKRNIPRTSNVRSRGIKTRPVSRGCGVLDDCLPRSSRYLYYLLPYRGLDLGVKNANRIETQPRFSVVKFHSIKKKNIFAFPRKTRYAVLSPSFVFNLLDTSRAQESKREKNIVGSTKAIKIRDETAAIVSLGSK